MSNEKPVELTEEETRIALVLFDCGAASSLAEAEDDVREVVAAREAAARREALLEAEERINKAIEWARVEAGELGAEDLRAALAEPERDEESGR